MVIIGVTHFFHVGFSPLCYFHFCPEEVAVFPANNSRGTIVTDSTEKRRDRQQEKQNWN